MKKDLQNLIFGVKRGLYLLIGLIIILIVVQFCLGEKESIENLKEVLKILLKIVRDLNLLEEVYKEIFMNGDEEKEEAFPSSSFLAAIIFQIYEMLSDIMSFCY